MRRTSGRQWHLDMSTARSGAGACVLGGRLYAVGGWGDGANRLSSVERYDEEKDEWEAVADMSTARFGAGACVLGGRLYAVGGKGDGLNYLSSVERYNEEKDEWEAVADMGIGRFCVAVAALCFAIDIPYTAADVAAPSLDD